jgi:uncharacterized membrane protein YphA (DoxX/SURF4 family)
MTGDERPRSDTTPLLAATTAHAFALRVMAFMLGLFFLFNGLDKLTWLLDSGILAARLDEWRQGGSPGSRWFIDTVAAPGVPLFARLVPLAEVSAGVALMLGFWTRLAALLALMMIGSFHFSRGVFLDREFLIDGLGFPVLGALIALVIGASRLPLSVSRQ